MGATLDLESSAERRGGSSPLTRTNFMRIVMISLTAVTNEIKRLEYTAWQCKQRNPFKLDIEYMEQAAKILRSYRDLHFSAPMPPFEIKE